MPLDKTHYRNKMIFLSEYKRQLQNVNKAKFMNTQLQQLNNDPEESNIEDVKIEGKAILESNGDQLNINTMQNDFI